MIWHHMQQKDLLQHSSRRLVHRIGTSTTCASRQRLRVYLLPDDPIQAVLQIRQHEFECFGPLGVTVELKSDSQICNSVLVDGICDLESAIL